MNCCRPASADFHCSSFVGGAHALQVTMAVLLLEMMRMDSQLKSEERDAIATTLQRECGLSVDELATLVVQADLLNVVGHADYVVAKPRARASAGLPAG